MFGRRPMSCARSTAHIELENTGNHDHCLRSTALVKHGKPDRLGTIDEDPTAEAALVPNNPITPAVLPDQKQRRFGTRRPARRLTIIFVFATVTSRGGSFGLTAVVLNAAAVVRLRSDSCSAEVVATNCIARCRTDLRHRLRTDSARSAHPAVSFNERT
jgi:hypothetical protein